MPNEIIWPLAAIASASVVAFGVAAAFAVIISVIDLMVIQRTRTAALPVGVVTRATDLWPLLMAQVVVAALTVFVPLTRSDAANVSIALVFSGGLLILVALNAWFGLVNWQRQRRGVIASPAPNLTLPPNFGNGVYRSVAPPPASEQRSKIAYLLLTLVAACYLVPWALDLVGIGPFGNITIIDAVFLGVGVIGLGLFLAGLATLDQRRVLVADAAGLSLRLGLAQRVIPWAQVSEVLVRDHGDGRWSYQVISATPRAVIMWFERPTARQTNGAISTSSMAAVALRRSAVKPTYLNPQETTERVRWAAQAAGSQIADRATKLVR